MSDNTATETVETAEQEFVPDESRYTVEGNNLIWTDIDGGEIVVPLRMPLSMIRKIKGLNLGDPEVMIDIIAALVENLDEDKVDFADFQHLFVTWQHVYNKRAEATLGESSR